MNTDREHSEQQKKQSRWGFRGMTFRDWLPIIGTLLIPVMVAAGSGWIIWHQGKIEGRRAEAVQKLAEQRAQDEALQAYLDQMSQLILDRKLLEAEQGDPVYVLAQARTSTVILRLDTEHNASVIRFLRDSGLTWSARNASSGRIRMGADSEELPPPASVSLLRGIALNRSDLSGANLSYADLSQANLSYADLFEADLSGTGLKGTGLSGGYVLNHVDLSHADLRRADLSGADLSYADLSYADLSGAKHITNEELEQKAGSLEGATMPNGQKYEDWLKDKESHGEDE